MTEADQPLIPVTPLDASTVLLIRDSDDGLEVFMVVRHSKADFAGGALVFPGGKVDPEDAAPKLEESHGINVTLPTRLMALRVAAIRETFEEASVLLARERGRTDLIGPKRQTALVRKYRVPIYEGDITMTEMINAENSRTGLRRNGFQSALIRIFSSPQRLTGWTRCMMAQSRSVRSGLPRKLLSPTRRPVIVL